MFDRKRRGKPGNHRSHPADRLRPRAVGPDLRDLGVRPLLGRAGFPEGLGEEEEERQQRVYTGYIMPAIRRGSAGDLTAVAEIQSQSPEASQWDPAGYLEHEFWVASESGAVAGF